MTDINKMKVHLRGSIGEDEIKKASPAAVNKRSSIESAADHPTSSMLMLGKSTTIGDKDNLPMTPRLTDSTQGIVTFPKDSNNSHNDSYVKVKL